MKKEKTNQGKKERIKKDSFAFYLSIDIVNQLGVIAGIKSKSKLVNQILTNFVNKKNLRGVSPSSQGKRKYHANVTRSEVIS